MRIPQRMPARATPSAGVPSSANSTSPSRAADGQVSPAACCAEACVNIPFIGRVCHCILDLPVCP